MALTPRRSIHAPGTLWLLLAIPGVMFLWNNLSGTAAPVDLIHPTGEMSARLMIIAMAIGPLVDVFGPRKPLVWLMRRRRYFGVAAFGYAVLHLVFYVIDMGQLDDMVAEALAPGIWTGWAAFALFVPMALTSNDTAMRALRRNWKRVQRLVYPAAVLTLLHWVWVHNNLTAALIHFVPLALLILVRLIMLRMRTMPNPSIPVQGV